MVQARESHNVIEIQGELLVIGGTPGTLKTERCNYVENEIKCKQQDPILGDYLGYPELFAVTDDYCK